MRPAFATSRQALAFALLLLALLLSPLLVGKSLLPSRSQIYSSIWWANGDFPYFSQQVYEEKGDIDIAFVGSSHLWNGISSRYVQEQLSKQLGRPAVVRTLCWGEAGSDSLYLIIRDLLQNRRVKLLVVDGDFGDFNRPHSLTPKWFRWADDAESLAGLPLEQQAIYYFASILGMPRNLVGLVRSNLPADLYSGRKTYYEIYAHALNPVSELGTMTARVGFKSDDQFAPFSSYSPDVEIPSSAVNIYSSDTAKNFDFSREPLPPLQSHFLRKFGDMVQQQASKLALIHIPIYDERRSPKIQERTFWPDTVSADMTLAGIPPALLFGSLTDENIRKLYGDSGHLNKNGQEYFTRIVTPALLQIYTSQVNR
jgi:hypothetical protein